MTRRRLRPDELTLWQEVARKTTPLSSKRKMPAPSFTEQSPQDSLARPIPRRKSPRNSRSDKPPGTAMAGMTCCRRSPERLKQAPVSMDKKAFQRLKRGKLVPEAKLDLHGMTLEQAHPALNGFILRSHATGHRLVLIVTGKGRDRDPGDAVPIRRGVSAPQRAAMAAYGAPVRAGVADHRGTSQTWRRRGVLRLSTTPALTPGAPEPRRSSSSASRTRNIPR